MRNYKIILLLFALTVLSCGKSPLLNKVSKNLNEISGGILLNEQFPNEKISFSINWITEPGLENLSSFELKLARPLSQTQTFNIYIWMPEMGHGSSPVEISQLNATDYSVREIAFIMPGLWILHIEILENNQVIDQWQKSIML